MHLSYILYVCPPPYIADSLESSGRATLSDEIFATTRTAEATAADNISVGRGGASRRIFKVLHSRLLRGKSSVESSIA